MAGNADFGANRVVHGDRQGDRTRRVLRAQAQGEHNLALVANGRCAGLLETRGQWKQRFGGAEILRPGKVEGGGHPGIAGIAPVGQRVIGQTQAQTGVAPGRGAAAIDQFRLRRSARRGVSLRKRKQGDCSCGNDENKNIGRGFSLRVHPLAYLQEIAGPHGCSGSRIGRIQNGGLCFAKPLRKSASNPPRAARWEAPRDQ